MWISWKCPTPNYDGASMPHFSGFPGQGGYNLDSDHDAKVDGKTEDTEENFAAEIASWQTKRERGADYVMGTGTWEEQMDKFQQLFVGKTVDEVEEWFEKYCSDLNGRPLKDGSDKEEDKAKYDALTEEEKAMLGRCDLRRHHEPPATAMAIFWQPSGIR